MTSTASSKEPDYRLRLTVGLRKRGDAWVVTHEHHSYPAV
ncbi:MAG TPA: nuclear transport factor 2 family protein [Mycobacteriales bacterium]|nr:nuclear transport factor 2 family protein [Mycobacteriales bacterium]